MAKKSDKNASKKAAPAPAIAGTIELGDRARDKVTGFTGIVAAETRWLNGCRRVQLTVEQTKPDGGGIDKDYVFDVQQVELLAKDPKGLAPKASAPKRGGDRDDTMSPTARVAGEDEH